MNTATRQAIVLRDFSDAGTEQQFTASGTPVPIDAGAFLNYVAAGLIEAAPAATTKRPAPTRQRKPGAAPAVPATPPATAGDPPAADGTPTA